MPKYAYVAKPGPYKTVQGVIESESEQDAVNKVNSMGYFPVSVKLLEPANRVKGVPFFRAVSTREVALFTAKLANLSSSGINILNALHILAAQEANRQLKLVIEDVDSRVRDGRSLSQALSAHPQIFSGLYTALIHSGEISGTLNETLNRLSGFLENEEELKSSVMAALTYPLFILAVSILTVSVLLGYVIPRLAGMFEDIGSILPLPTKILIGMSGALHNWWWLILLVILFSAFLVQRFYSTEKGKEALDGLRLKIYLFGDITLKRQTARLARTMSLLISGGIPIIQAMDIAGSVLTNGVLSSEVRRFREKISRGASLSGCLKESRVFPAFMADIVSIAEETGTLGRSLARIADDYEKDVDRTVKALTRLLEPAIILLMGLVVGFIVLSMLLPIFQINLIIK